MSESLKGAPNNDHKQYSFSVWQTKGLFTCRQYESQERSGFSACAINMDSVSAGGKVALDEQVVKIPVRQTAQARSSD